jgi:hypothetical protein
MSEKTRHYILCALVAFTVEMTVPSVPAAYKALLVGCDDWADDVDPMKTAMLNWDTVYWKPENIKTLQNPTGTAVLNEINTIKGTNPDFFFFAYTGHGEGKDVYDNGNGYAVGLAETSPASNSVDEWLHTNNDDWISDDALTGALMQFNNKLVLLDSCFSGGFWNDGSNEGDLENTLYGTMCLYAACSEIVRAPPESPLWNRCKNSCEYGAASYGDNVITVQEWYDFSKTTVPSYIFCNGQDILTVPVFAIPEPATLTLLGLGGLAMLRRRR